MLYPEQNEARLKLSLDGTWAFALGSCVEDQFDPAKPLPDAQPIAVPASYNDQNDQTTALRRHYGWAWYQRKVTLPTFCAGQRVVLRFGSVTHTANVWLNGQLIAQHKGGFTPFEADVTALLHPGETVLLTVACDNRVNHSTLPVGNEDGQLAFFGSDNAGIPSVEAAKRAAAPQNRPNFDFFNYAGIHRPVWLYTTPKEYIEDVTVVPAVDGTVQYAVKTTGSAPVHVMVASLNGKPLTLSPMEYKMLNLFRKNPRQVLTRGQLLEKLWDIDERFVDEHTLTTSISRIRSKIESDGGAPYIKTVYGMGYQWTGGEAK